MEPGSEDSLKTLIHGRSMMKARIIDGPSYTFPERLQSTDWVAAGIVVAAMLLLTIVGFWF